MGDLSVIDSLGAARVPRRELRVAGPLQSGLAMTAPALGLLSVDRPRRLHLAGKRMFDIALSLAALVVLAPLLMGLAVAIKVSSPGPVLFRQAREGHFGRSFMALKFRTMAAARCDGSGVAQTAANDQRVTALGRVMRRTSLDELPQLFNVLWGDMSLVGPRPHVPGMVAGGMSYRDLVPYYDYRLIMRPGLTGWAQANGWRGPTDRAENAMARIDHDVAYIQNFSLWLDLKIVWQTLRREFLSGTGS